MFDLNLKVILPSVIVSILTGVISFYTTKIYFLRQKYKHIPGPPADGIFGFYTGNVREIMRAARYENKILMEIFAEWIEKYGTTIKVQILSQVIVLTIDLKATKDILIELNFPKHPRIYSFLGYPYEQRFVGKGLLTDTDTERWKHRRALFNPAFHKHVLKGFMDEFNTKGDLLLEKIRSLADGKTVVTILDEFNHAALDVIATIAFGMESNCLTNPNNTLNTQITECLKGLFKYATSKNIGFDLTNLKDFNYKSKYVKVVQSLREIGRIQIESRLKLLQEGSYVPNDLLTITLKSYENEAFDMDDMIDDFITFFVAGQETTANTLAFCFLELARNPLIVQKLRKEIDSVFGSRTSINYEELADLHYTSCVIKETLRLWPVAPSLARIVPYDYEINSINIPKGTWIQTSTFVSARHPDYYKDPLEFKPERFLSENNSDGIRTYSYFPFSLGPRNCIGQNFAQIEMKILISKLIKNFDFDLVPEQKMNLIQLLTLRPAEGTKCYVSPRKND